MPLVAKRRWMDRSLDGAQRFEAAPPHDRAFAQASACCLELAPKRAGLRA